MFYRLFSTKRRKKEELSFKEKANIWIISKWGRRFRIGLLAGTVVIYPVYHLITNGPLLGYLFSKKHNVDSYDSVPYLKKIVDQEYLTFCEKEARLPKDAITNFLVQKNMESLDTIGDGSLGVRFGAQLALPFYTRFTSEEEALEYCRKNFPVLKLFGKTVEINWDTPTGKELLETFVLSPQAVRFLVMRDMLANDGYNAFANRAISWATWTSFTSIFTYWFHQKTKFCNGTALSFAVVYSIFLIFAICAHDQWFLLYRFLADTHGDSISSRMSEEYSAGGKEFYWKMLKRNRILRDLIPNGHEYITAVGDLRSITTKLIVRYDLLKDVGIEDDEVRDVAQGDD
uniref:Transmembrane protein n=1 Tax=Panagrolaimus sp. JU765 TaxID=591449 RepID=A0AC34QKP8_9BILA